MAWTQREAGEMQRRDPDLAADERTSLVQFLDYHRATLVQKVSDVPAAGLSGRTVPSSGLTLSGLIKHLALVEDHWFQEVFSGRPMPEPWASAPFDDDPDWEFHSAEHDRAEDLVALYAAACARSRAAVDGAASLDQRSAGTAKTTGETFSLRWILLHMLEETARHNGHADLLREATDGTVGE